MKYLLLITIIGLSSCSIQDYEIDRLALLCGGHNEIKWVHWMPWLHVHCVGGDRFDVTD